MGLLLSTATGAAVLGLASGGYAYASSWPTSQLFGRTLVAGPDREPTRHTVALTFDDGPSPRNTPALLELLAEHKVCATFFLIGEHVRKHPDMARRIVSAGHVTGNHTAMHPNLARRNQHRVREELTGCQKTIADVTGCEPRLFRPPYGARRPATLRVARELGLVPVMWNVTGHDWSTWSAEKILQRVERGLARNRRRGMASNVLLHDAGNLDGTDPVSRAGTLAAVQALLQRDAVRFTTPLEWLPELRGGVTAPRP